ncbi:MAG: hypothetical protein WD042_02165 [Phycisphaeraceae bacterium]
MLSQHRIERDFSLGRFDSLLHALVQHQGLDLPPSLVIRLSSSPTGAIALGLRRLTELTYGPTALGRAMTDRLLAEQDTHGSFAHDPLATACAIAAMNRLLRDHMVPPANQPAVRQARERAIAALAQMQAHADALCPAFLTSEDPASEAGEYPSRDETADLHDPLFAHPDDRTWQDRAATAAFALYLLADDHDFRAAIRFADLLDWFEAHQDDLDPTTHQLWEMALLTAPQAQLAALAA